MKALVDNNPDMLFDKVATLIEQARTCVNKAVNTKMVYTYFAIGRYIVEHQQQGEQRAQYGKETIKKLSQALTDRYGKGWSVDTLEKIRAFFLMYSKSASLMRKSSGAEIRNTVAEI